MYRRCPPLHVCDTVTLPYSCNLLISNICKNESAESDHKLDTRIVEVQGVEYSYSGIDHLVGMYPIYEPNVTLAECFWCTVEVSGSVWNWSVVGDNRTGRPVMDGPDYDEPAHLHADFRFFDNDLYHASSGEYGQEWIQLAVHTMKEDRFEEGLLLKSLEKSALYPYVNMSYFNVTSLDRSSRSVDDVALITDEIWSGYSGPYSASPGCISTRHGSYEEMECIGKVGTPVLPKRPANINTIYYLTSFKAEGNLANLQQTWRTWTGANLILWQCPQMLQLRRLTFYKHLAPKDGAIVFILLCECSEGLTNRYASLYFLDRLRDRRCGRVDIYKIEQVY